MTRAYLVLNDALIRAKAIRWIAGLPVGTRVEFKSPRRTLPQSDKMWAMLQEVADQVTHFGHKYPKETWKLIMMHELGVETQFVPSLDGSELLPIGGSSSDLGKDEMSDLIEIIYARGAERGVKFRGPREAAA